jgi:hypothetical protein
MKWRYINIFSIIIIIIIINATLMILKGTQLFHKSTFKISRSMAPLEAFQAVALSWL